MEMCKQGIPACILIVIALTGLSANVQAQSDDELVAEWHFDEGSGSVVKDSMKGKILFDESHHQIWSIDAGLADFAKELRNNGYQLDRVTDGPITYDKLKNFDVFVMPNGWIIESKGGVKLLTDDEIKAVKKFVADGGGLFLLGGGWPWVDYTGLSIEKAPVNQIGKEFGITSNDDIIYDPTNRYPSCKEGEGCPIFHKPFIKDHPITKDVYEITNCKAFPSSLTINEPSVDIVISGDEDSYTGYRGEYYKKGENPPFLAVTEYGKGKVVFVQSEVFLSSDDHNKDGIKNLYEYDNKKLGLNIIDWLALPILDQDNDGVPDAEDMFPAIPQKYVYCAICLLVLACTAGACIVLKRNTNKRRRRDFYDNLNVAITPETDSYEVGDTVSFDTTVSNTVGDITSGCVESSMFNRIEFKKIKRGEKYSEKVAVDSKEIGTLIGTATAIVKDEYGNEHVLKTSFEAEITPFRPKLKLELTNERVVKPLEQSYLLLSLSNGGKGKAENVSLDVQADGSIEIGEYPVLNAIESNSTGKIRIPYTCLSAGEFNVRVVAKYRNGKQYQEVASIAVQMLPLKPEGRLAVEFPQSMKVGEQVNGLLTIRNDGEDTMLNARTSIDGMDITIPVFSRIEPKKEVMEKFPVTFSSHGSKTVKFVIEYEDEIGKRYSISEEKSILVRGLLLKPGITIDVPSALVRGEPVSGKIIVRNEGEEVIKDAHLAVLVNGKEVKVAEPGELRPLEEKTTDLTIKTDSERAEIVVNLTYKDILGNEYTYQERGSIAVRERTVFASSAVNYQGTVILYKVKVENKLPKPISDIRIKAFVPDVFLIKEEEKAIAMLEPGNARTVTFEIRPTGECGECNISGRVNYYNHLIDKREEIEIPVKSVSIICPLLKAREISEEEWRTLVSSMVVAGENTKEEIPISAKSLFGMVWLLTS